MILWYLHLISSLPSVPPYSSQFTFHSIFDLLLISYFCLHFHHYWLIHIFKTWPNHYSNSFETPYCQCFPFQFLTQFAPTSCFNKRNSLLKIQPNTLVYDIAAIISNDWFLVKALHKLSLQSCSLWLILIGTIIFV